MFFNSPDLGLATAAVGTFDLLPARAMIADLQRDYAAMSGMVFGEIPDFEAVLDSVAALQQRLNEAN